MDSDVFVPVRSRVFVPQANRMSKFMDCIAYTGAAFRYSDVLCPNTLPSDTAATSIGGEGNGNNKMAEIPTNYQTTVDNE